MSSISVRHRPPLLRAWLLAWALLPGCERGSAPPEGSADAPAAPGGAQADAPAADGADAAPTEPAGPPLPAAEGILDKAAVAMGGAEAVGGIESFHSRGTVEIVGQNIKGDLNIWWKDGDFYMEQIIPGVGEMRAGKQGDRIWSEDPFNGLRTLGGVEAEQHAWASSLLLAADWRRYFHSARTVAEREVDGHPVHDVVLASDSGLEVTMSFDAETGLQVGQSFEQITPMGRQPFVVTFEDYRDVDGVKIAFRQSIDAKYQEILQVIDEVELNAEVDESKFAFPRKGADLVKQSASSSPSQGG